MEGRILDTAATALQVATPRPGLIVDDLVLVKGGVKDENLPPMKWLTLVK